MTVDNCLVEKIRSLRLKSKCLSSVTAQMDIQKGRSKPEKGLRRRNAVRVSTLCQGFYVKALKPRSSYQDSNPNVLV